MIRKITVNSFPEKMTFEVGASYPEVHKGDRIKHPDIRGLVEVLKVEEVG